MKKLINCVVCTVLCIAMVLTVCAITAGAENYAVSFSDVPSSHWAYETIMDMTERGLFKGTAEPVNGVGVFAPDKEMTRAEFVTVVLRVLYPDEAAKIENTAGEWWRNWYSFAVDKGLLYDHELDGGDMGKAMSRQEMAMVLVRCVAEKGESLEGLVEISRIADYNSIGRYYQEYVRECFSFGLICGVDSIGTFAPMKSLTRAEAATVLARLVNKDLRIAVVIIETDDEIESEEDEGDEVIDGTNLVMPWEEEGAKPPEEYTWEEYLALTEQQKIIFKDSFASPEAYDSWLVKHGQKEPEDTVTIPGASEDENVPKTEISDGQDNIDIEVMPWEELGAKAPKDYTWSEYQKLTAAQKEVFKDSFASPEAYDEWLVKCGQKEPENNNSNSGSGSSGNNSSAGQDYFEIEIMPWENPGAKAPEDYTWADYQKLTATQKEVFPYSFATPDAYDEWLEKNKA